ncbi:MAG TPA: type II toxin-antitoxin system RelE/ParE family toxin [Deltaproteobacteria bacterium]|nr:type II toxin-antitoxin system RelE/ParE family toxin [Deltaproteobacteria bacterium]
MKVFWSKEALQRLIEIEAFIAEDNEVKAVEFTDDLVDQSLMIEENPKIGRVVPEFMDNNIRELLIKGYRMVYGLGGGRINILTVFEGHRQIRKTEIFQDKE